MSGLVGRTINRLRTMTAQEAELESLQFDRSLVVLELDDGTRLFPRQALHTHHAGFLFAISSEGTVQLVTGD